MSGAKKPWRQDMPDFLQFLENPLGHPVRLHEEVLGMTCTSRTSRTGS
jgi:hypothetical protein